MVDASLVMSDGRALTVRDGFVIGRATGCDLVLDDGKCSRKHARICIEGSVVEILDLDSSNGTLLNGKPVQRRLLRDGDKVQIGATVIVYREGVVAAPEAPAMPAPAAAVVVPAPPPKPAVGAAPAGEPAGADDDVDLFGGAEKAAPMPATMPAKPMPAKPMPARSAAPPASVPEPAPAPARTAPAPSDPMPSDVVEFADEVVEVRSAAKPAPAPMTALPGDGAPRIEKAQRVLQFSKHKAAAGPLGDDLAQLSPGLRTVLYAAVLAGAGGIAWLIIVLMR
jgi:predicted component of type VI protein secretion system